MNVHYASIKNTTFTESRCLKVARPAFCVIVVRPTSETKYNLRVVLRSWKQRKKRKLRDMRGLTCWIRLWVHACPSFAFL